MRIIARIIAGTDMVFGLTVFVVTTWTFNLFPQLGAVPQGMELLVALGATVFFAHSPDADFVPYLMIKRGLSFFVIVAGAALFLTGMVLTALDMKFRTGLYPATIALSITGWLFLLASMMKEKVLARSSHWPLWHHPILFTAIVASIAWLTASAWFPAYMAYGIALATSATVLHFLHDSVQKQGFPFLSPFTDTHFQLSWSGFSAKWKHETFAHYAVQARPRKSSTKHEMESRAPPVSALQLLLAGAAAAGTTATLVYFGW